VTAECAGRQWQMGPSATLLSIRRLWHPGFAPPNSISPSISSPSSLFFPGAVQRSSLENLCDGKQGYFVLWTNRTRQCAFYWYSWNTRLRYWEIIGRKRKEMENKIYLPHWIGKLMWV
jgi:hypothetical protein